MIFELVTPEKLIGQVFNVSGLVGPFLCTRALKFAMNIN